MRRGGEERREEGMRRGWEEEGGGEREDVERREKVGREVILVEVTSGFMRSKLTNQSL